MRLSNKRIAVFVEEGFEDLEFWVTVMRLREEGAQVTIVRRQGQPHRQEQKWRIDRDEPGRCRLGARG
jgi:putative intracellular protease/amidase